jgi:hypothetical protein
LFEFHEARRMAGFVVSGPGMIQSPHVAEPASSEPFEIGSS